MNQDRKASNGGNIILVFIAMVTGVLIGLLFGTRRDMQEGTLSLQGKMGEVLRLVEDEYVDSVNADSLTERLVAAMMGELDPHSAYLSAKETERSLEMLRGSFEGVGIVLRHEGDSVYVGQILSDGPSVGSGLMPGDMIWQVDGRRVSGVGMKADTVVSLLRGPRRSWVEVTAKRVIPSSDREHPQYTTQTVKIRRDVVSYRSLPYSGMLNDTTGYIFLSSFTTTSHEEFHEALQRLCRKGMRHLVIDLRNNPGGALNSAVAIANELLPEGSLILYTQGAHQRREDYYARRGGLFTQGRVTVMVDEGSASASEVLSGALQDNDRALIVGHRTFGKGLVQREFSLGDGSSVHLTVARYYTPSGRCIQRPYSQGTDEYYRDYLDQLVEESYSENPTTRITDSTPYYTRSGRVVYGGGGIQPDHLLSYKRDTTFVYYNRLMRAGVPYKVAFSEVKHQASELLRRYPNAAAFCNGYQVGEALLRQVVQAGKDAGVPYDARAFAAKKNLLSNIIKANIGNWLYGEEAFYRVYLSEDADLQRVLHNDYPKNNPL